MADTPKIYEALSQVQNELRAPKDAYNAFGKYNYRTAEGILCMAKPICERNGVVLTLSDRPTIVGDWHYIESTATATLAQDPTQQVSVTTSVRESASRAGMDSAQITGGAVSYARKYALCGLLAIDSGRSDPDVSNQHIEQKGTTEAHMAICSECGQPIKDEVVNGATYEAKRWAAQSVKRYGQPLCAHCYMEKRKAEGKA